jgi:hypothetical protein
LWRIVREWKELNPNGTMDLEEEGEEDIEIDEGPEEDAVSEEEYSIITGMMRLHNELNKKEYKFYFKRLPQEAAKFGVTLRNWNSFIQIDFDKMTFDRLLCITRVIMDIYLLDWDLELRMQNDEFYRRKKEKHSRIIV